MKRFLSIMLCFLIGFSTMGCSTSKSENTDTTEKKDVKTETVSKKEFIDLMPGGEVILEDYGNFTLTKAYISKKIDPPNPGSFYTYYEAKEPNTSYLDTVITFKNTSTNTISADEVANVQVIYDGKYKYETFSAIEENNGEDFTFTNITNIESLKSGNLHFLAEVPDEVTTSGKSIEISIKINGKEYRYKMQ